MRLHRGRDRRANRTLHLIAEPRLRHDARNQVYTERRRAEGLSKRGVLRCLKRFIAREFSNALKEDLLYNDPLTSIGPAFKSVRTPIDLHVLISTLRPVRGMIRCQSKVVLLLATALHSGC